MPMCSGATGIILPEDELFRRTTQFAWPYCPHHTFHFAKPEGVGKADFEKHFFLDNGAHYKKDRHAVWVSLPDDIEVNLNDHSAHHLRLYALKQFLPEAKYYLAPWLTVAFRFAAGMFTPVARTGSAPLVIRIQVNPYSIYETLISDATRTAIENAFATSTTPPTLRLVASSPLSAVWAANGATHCDEKDCLKPQDVLITVSDSQNPYTYQQHVDIVNSANEVVGRLYLLFLREITHNVIFFEVRRASDTQLSIHMLNPANNFTVTKTKYDADGNPSTQTSSTSAAHCLQQLNDYYAKIGLRFNAVTPALTVAGAICDTNNPCTISGQPAPGTVLGNVFKVTDPVPYHPVEILNAVDHNFMNNILEATRGQYLFLFLAGWANGSQPGGETTGISYTGRRAAHVLEFNHVKKEFDARTIVHESAHAMGIEHYFYEDAGAPAYNDAQIASSASSTVNHSYRTLSQINIATQTAFYQRHDDMNAGNACDVFDTAAASATAVQDHFHRFYIDRYPIHETKNLMDYLKPSQSSAGVAGDLVKFQIEVLRYMVGGGRVDMQGP